MIYIIKNGYIYRKNNNKLNKNILIYKYNIRIKLNNVGNYMRNMIIYWLNLMHI